MPVLGDQACDGSNGGGYAHADGDECTCNSGKDRYDLVAREEVHCHFLMCSPVLSDEACNGGNCGGYAKADGDEGADNSSKNRNDLIT